ncbi:site-specific integrase [Streptomyces sp. NPDC052179]|uniref:tyrosine-type recombinase/integrase n=1 Tax=Streptomyces sp. NPDC052179 TaxID=3155680 RepID=UPI0034400DFB
MASVHPRVNKLGEITSYQVKWRLGGGRSGDSQSERFDDEVPAEVFKAAVDEHGQQWPPGWVKGVGFIAPDAADEAQFNFKAYALLSIKNRTGVEDYYRDAIEKELRTYILPTFGNCDIRSTKHFSKATVGAWVNKMAKTRVWRGSVHKEMSPKTLKNLHGLLSSILREATMEEPPLRLRNPCDLTRLPRTDDDGISEDGDDEDMCFLTPDEVQGIANEFESPRGRRFVRRKFATGCRWGELTAVAKRQVYRDPKDGKPKLRISRAWKRKKGGGYYLGTPKSKRSRRTMRLDEITYAEWMEDGLEELEPGDLVHHNGQGERLPYSTFYDQWEVAVRKAKEAGTVDPDKSPTIHDLRHSLAALLLSEGRSLTYVQRRLGHESIKTTSDKYGHLLPVADDDAMDTIERGLGGPGPSVAALDDDEVPYELSERAAANGTRRVYVVHLGAHKEGFWDLDDARALAGQWYVEKGDEALIEVWTSTWWTRSAHGGRGGGLELVRYRVPERLRVWQIGPAYYSVDGTQRVERPEDHEPRAAWTWEWESTFTDEQAVPHAEWGRNGETEARAYGVSRGAVVAAYAAARSDALRVCGHHPQAPRPEEPAPGMSKI